MPEYKSAMANAPSGRVALGWFAFLVRGRWLRIAWKQKGKLVGGSIQAGSLCYFALRTGARGIEIILQRAMPSGISHKTIAKSWTTRPSE
jgi:hypothetical protein